MITHITGTVKAVQHQSITVNIGALGLAVQVPQESVFQLGQKVELHAYMHWNQEQGPSLFGFRSVGEKAVFLMVISCPGIGPKIALSVLADLGPQRFVEIVQAADERALSTVSGIGPKKAEQMIVQLKHKVAKMTAEVGVEVEGAENFQTWQNVADVLQSLNYSRTEINGAMQHVRETNAGKQAPFDQLMRQALSFLSKRV